MNNNIFLALSSKKNAVAVAKMLISEGIHITSVLKNTSELSSMYSYYNGGIIITSCRFLGIQINSFIDDIPDEYTIILLGSKEQLSLYDNDNVFKLALPLRKNDLICAVDMMAAFESSYSPSNKKTSEEEKLIERAKHALIDTYTMTEEQAHRYIQKKSMDTGRKLVDIAKIILEI